MEKLDRSIKISDRWLGKPVTRHVRDFGYLVGAICLLIGAAKLYLGGHALMASLWIAVGFALALGGAFSPATLKPVWFYWMKFALLLGLVMTFLLVSLAWFVMFIPVGLFFKLIGKKTVNVEFRSSKASYWDDRDEKTNDFKLLERQF